QTDPRVAVGVLDHRAAVELAQPHLARAGGDLGVARRPLDAAVAHAALQLQCACAVDLDATEARLDPAVAELAVTANVGQGPRAADIRAGRQLDGHVDRPAALPAQPRAELRALDQQQLVRVLDARLLDGLDVLLVGCVARVQLDDRGATLAGRDADIAEREIDAGGNAFGGVEG